MKTMICRLLSLAALVSAGLIPTGSAAVTSHPVSVTALPGFTTIIPLHIIPDTPVAGINGELTYDPNLFHSPTIQQGGGTNGFQVLGNQSSPGSYKFVVYSNPVLPINAGPVTLYIQLTNSASQQVGQVYTLTYNFEAASDPSGNSLLGVDFANVTVTPGQFRNASENWMLYR